jgi:hypothetical protein
MANLWQFFGLPDPEGSTSREAAPATTLTPAPTPVHVEQTTLESIGLALSRPMENRSTTLDFILDAHKHFHPRP